MTKVFKYINDPDLCLFVPQMTIGQEADYYCHRCVHTYLHHFDDHYLCYDNCVASKGLLKAQFVFHSGPEEIF